MLNLNNKVAIIPGSGQGIGQGIAERFARDGAKIIADYLGDPDGAQKTLAIIDACGSRGVMVEADIKVAEDREKLLPAAISTFGTIDVLVNSAGMEKKAEFWSVAEFGYDKVMSVNKKGPFFHMQVFVNRLRELRRKGSILNISSVHEDMSFPGFSTYRLSKGAMRMFSSDLAIQRGPLGITINVALGAIQMLINKSLQTNEAEMDALLKTFPSPAWAPSKMWPAWLRSLLRKMLPM